MILTEEELLTLHQLGECALAEEVIKLRAKLKDKDKDTEATYKPLKAPPPAILSYSYTN